MKYLTLFLLSLFMLGCHEINGTRSDQEVRSKLDSLMHSVVQNKKFSGVVLLGNREKIIYKNAWGIANRDWNIPMSTEDQFDIASLNKSFIAVLVLLAEKDGKWQLEDPITKHLSKGVIKGQFNEKMTFHHLLTHTSGLPDYDGVPDDLKFHNYQKFKRLHFTNTDYLNYIGQLKPLHEPGTAFHYSNFGYHLLALLLEDAYGESFNQLMQRKICRPLNLKNTVSYTSNTEVKKGLVTGYSFDTEKDLWTSNQFIDLSLGRRIFSTADDLYIWAKALDQGKFIDEDMKSKILRNHVQHLDTRLSYGYGLVIHDGSQDFAMGNINLKSPYFIHGGKTEGYKSLMINISGSDLILILLTNSGDQINELLLAENIIKTINN